MLVKKYTQKLCFQILRLRAKLSVPLENYNLHQKIDFRCGYSLMYDKVGGSRWPTSLRRWHLLFTVLLSGFESQQSQE